MKNRHLQILNTVNDMLNYFIGAIVIIAILLFVLAFNSESSADAPATDSNPEYSANTSVITSTADLTRLWIEETFSPEDLYLWDEFHGLTDAGHIDQEAIDVLVERTGITEQLLKEHLQNLQHWIATKDYPYTPEGIKTDILEPAISFHPGTAGFSLQRAQAAADILFNTADHHFQFARNLDETMAEAANMLTEEEQGWLKENLPGLIEEIDNVLGDYPEIEDVYRDAGASSYVYRAMQKEASYEDWAIMKTALLTAAAR